MLSSRSPSRSPTKGNSSPSRSPAKGNSSPSRSSSKVKKPTAVVVTPRAGGSLLGLFPSFDVLAVLEAFEFHSHLKSIFPTKPENVHFSSSFNVVSLLSECPQLKGVDLLFVTVPFSQVSDLKKFSSVSSLSEEEENEEEEEETLSRGKTKLTHQPEEEDPVARLSPFFMDIVKLIRVLEPKFFVLDFPTTIKAVPKVLLETLSHQIQQQDYDLDSRDCNFLQHLIPQTRQRFIFLGTRRSEEAEEEEEKNNSQSSPLSHVQSFDQLVPSGVVLSDCREAASSYNYLNPESSMYNDLASLNNRKKRKILDPALPALSITGLSASPDTFVEEKSDDDSRVFRHLTLREFGGLLSFPIKTVDLLDTNLSTTDKKFHSLYESTAPNLAFFLGRLVFRLIRRQRLQNDPEKFLSAHMPCYFEPSCRIAPPAIAKKVVNTKSSSSSKKTQQAPASPKNQKDTSASDINLQVQVFNAFDQSFAFIDLSVWIENPGLDSLLPHLSWVRPTQNRRKGYQSLSLPVISSINEVIFINRDPKEFKFAGGSPHKRPRVSPQFVQEENEDTE